MECHIGIFKAVVMEDSVSKENPALDKALFSSAMKLPASKRKCFFLQDIGEFCLSIGEVDDARLCYVEALRSAKEWPASYEKCAFLKDAGELCESISEIALARQCYDEALNTCREESKIVKKPPFVEIKLEMRLGMLGKKMFSVDSAQRIHYDRAADILWQHVATGHVNSRTVLMFQALAEAYGSIDRNEKIRLLLESLKVSEIVYGEDKSHEMVTTSLQELSRTYYLLEDIQNSMKYRERQIEMQLELYSSNPFVERILNSLMKWAFTSFEFPCGNNSIERVCDFFLSSLNNKAYLLNTTAAKIVAAKCFTFIAVLFYTSTDFEKAKSLSGKASQLFGAVQDCVEAESDPCRETCDLMKTILSSEIILPSHRRQLYISVLSIGDPYPDSVSDDEDRYRAANEELIKEVKERAQSTLVEEQNTLSSLPIFPHSQLECLENYKSQGEFQLAAEIHSSLQPQLLSFYENSPFDGAEKLISDAIKAKDENEPINAVGFLDLALQLQRPKARCRRAPKILRLRGECFLSMGLFRSAAIDFTKADALYSIETTDNREDLYEYSEVLIGLIKSEILCFNVEAAWLVCKKGIKLALDHELKETINQQRVKLLHLGVKCVNILLEQLTREEDEESKLAQAHCLSQEALSLCNLMEEVGASETELLVAKFEVKLRLTSFNIFPAFQQKNENESLCERVMSSVSADVISDLEPERLINFGIHCLMIARLLIMSGDIEQSINWLDKSLVAFFSTVLPDFLWYYEEFLPLLQAITATKSSSPDQNRSPFRQAIDKCTRMLTNQDKSSNYVNKFLTTLIIVYRSLGQAQEAIVVAEIGLEIADLMFYNSESNKVNDRCRMLLHLAQIHQQNSSNSVFNADEELNLAERYYISDRGRKENFVLRKDLSYANFLCERKRFAEAVSILEDIRNLGEPIWNKYVYVEYFSCAFYGAGVEKSVKIDGELFTTVGDVLYNLMVRAYVGMEKKKEAVATCETFTDVNLLDVHEQLFGKRPSCKPHLVEDCHRELLSLLNEEDQNHFPNCDFPLSSANLAKLYHMLGEYEMALKYVPKDVESPEMLEMKISCLRLAGNELVNLNREDESLSFFQQFLEVLQDKEGFLDKPFNSQCEILQTYSFANQYYLFCSLGETHTERENIDAAIQCYERCIELNEDFTCDQDIVATLSELYQTKALTVDLGNEDLRKVYMDLAWELFQNLFQKNVEMNTFVELSFASLLTRLDRYEEAVDHFYKVIERADDMSVVAFGTLDKPLVDDCIRFFIEDLGGSVDIPIQVFAVYELILTLMKSNQIEKAQKFAIFFESVAKKHPLSSHYGVITYSLAGYAYMITENTEKAAEIFVSLLEINPGHPSVTEALESLASELRQKTPVNRERKD